MKKTYNQPTCLAVELRGRDAMLQSISSNSTSTGLAGTSWGGSTSSASEPISGDVKGMTDVNVWDEEW